jgi:hypothetical protein
MLGGQGRYGCAQDHRRSSEAGHGIDSHPISQLFLYVRDELAAQVSRGGQMVAIYAISS